MQVVKIDIAKLHKELAEHTYVVTGSKSVVSLSDVLRVISSAIESADKEE